MSDLLAIEHAIDALDGDAAWAHRVRAARMALADVQSEVATLRAENEHWKAAYNGAMKSLADQALKLGQEAHTARVEAEDLRAENEAMRKALVEIRELKASDCDFDGYVYVANETARTALAAKEKA